MADKILAEDPQYLWAQLLATRALLAVIATELLEREVVREMGRQRVEGLRIAALTKPVSETFLEGLDGFEQWLETDAALAPFRARP